MSSKTDPITDTYQDVEKLIRLMCHRFTRKHGGDFDEWFAEANLVYLDAYEQFNPDLGVPFSHYLCPCIWRRLLGKKRQEWRRQVVRGQNDVAIAAAPQKPAPTFSLDDFVQQLSRDAAAVVQLVVDAPADLVAVAEGKGGSGVNWSSSIRTYLRRQMGWGPARVREAMDELAGAVA